jgi:hypothetical protein
MPQTPIKDHEAVLAELRAAADKATARHEAAWGALADARAAFDAGSPFDDRADQNAAWDAVVAAGNEKDAAWGEAVAAWDAFHRAEKRPPPRP